MAAHSLTPLVCPKSASKGKNGAEKILLTNRRNSLFFSLVQVMEEIEITSWLTLDAIKKKAKVVESIGNLQAGHGMSVFAIIEDDFLELSYSDSAANYLRRFEDRNEFDLALEQRKEEDGQSTYEVEERDYDEDDEEEERDVKDESDNY
jgi:hypothetical protein